jgi:flagellar basal-body rod protein FlgG
MGGLVEIASSILSGASRSAEVSAQNISNMTTAGYKRRLEFAQVLEAAGNVPDASASSVDFTSGKLLDTGSPYDLALAGEGFFVVRTRAEAVAYTRDGQFTRDPEGRLVDGRGSALQADGRDLILKGARVEILADGVVLEDGEPTARLDLVDFTDRALATPTQDGFLAPAEAVEVLTRPSVRQGALEASNVSTAAEMVSVMAAVRRAQAGQRLVGVYDDLMGRVITTFGQA